MSYQLTDQERRAIAELPPDRRYDYFAAHVVEWEEVWSLRHGDEWVIMRSDDGEECLPVWPHSEFAADWASGEWADCSPSGITLDVWIERWLPGMERDGTLVAVFPEENEEGFVVDPGELRDTLLAQMEKQGKA